MLKSDRYFEGQCTICGNNTKVRNKNIYIVGSEGTDMCWPCEKDMIDYLDKKKRTFIYMKLMKIKNRLKRK